MQLKKILTTAIASRSFIPFQFRATAFSLGSIIAPVMALTAPRILITQTVRKEKVPRNDENMAIECNVLPESPHGIKKIASLVRLSLQSYAHKSSNWLWES